MFERIVLRHSESGETFSFGEIAEALIFYRRVHLILDRGTIINLVKQVGLTSFFQLIEFERISSVYIENHAGTLSQRVGLAEQHSFVAISLGGKQPTRRNRVERLAEVFSKIGLDKRQSRHSAERLLKTVKVKSITSDDFVPGGVLKTAAGDLRDREYLKSAVRRAIGDEFLQSHASLDFYFEAVDFGRHFEIATDLNLRLISELKGQSGGPSDISIAGLLTNILTARADMAFAAYYGCDFRTSAISSEILQIKHADLLRRSGINSGEISGFKEVVLTDMPSVAEVLDAGERGPDEFFKLLESSSRFASWASDLSPDEKIVAEYFNAATSTGWIGSLQGKSTRFVIGTAVGTFNPIAGAIASLADTFVVEKLLGGWRPSHFIDRKLKPFLMPAG